MNTLAIECSCQQGSIAVMLDDSLVRSWEFSSPRGRGTGLFTSLDVALRECGDIGRVVVGTGPGSYNGLRMAIATAWGIARARGASLSGVSSLLGYGAAEYFVVGDARANQWFLAHVLHGAFLLPPALVPPQKAREILKPGIPVFTASLLDELPEAVIAPPLAEVLASRSSPDGLPVPIYLKPPHITKPIA